MQPFNDWLFQLAIRGKGYNHAGPVAVTGEAAFMKLLAQFDPSLCIDVGANRGHYSEALLTLTNTKIIAFEPLPKAFESLRALQERFPSRVEVVNKGVGNLNCELDLHYGAEDSELASFSEEVNGIDYVREENQNVIKVPVTTLDSFFSEQDYASIKHIDLMKIDTEGYEYEVLCGATETLARIRPRFIQIEYNWHQLFKNQSLFSISKLLDNYDVYQLLPENGGMSKVDARLPQNNVYQYSNFVFVRADIDTALLRSR
jgi:FkbM family methyltransferase